jgi:hypothetical protein
VLGTDLEQALQVLGELLADRQRPFEVYAVGGGSLLLLGVIERPTKDLDLVAIVRGGTFTSAAPLPPELKRASIEVAELLGLDREWLNAGPADLMQLGLPAGYDSRLVSRTSGRFDQICFKLYAAVDQGPRSKHVADLRRIAPSQKELIAAARWARTHDPSDAFLDQLEQALETFGVRDHDDL